MNVHLVVLVGLLVGLIFLSYLVALGSKRGPKSYKTLKLTEVYKASYQGYLGPIEREVWRQILSDQVADLEARGWSTPAIQKAYLSRLQVPKDLFQHKSYLEERFAETQSFGAPVFQAMWRASNYQNQPQVAKDLLHLTMFLFSMPKDLTGKELAEGQFLPQFSKDLEPASSFWQVFSQTVQTAFPKDKLERDGLLAQQVHQFRYVISGQQAQWLRDHFRAPEASDAQSLASYIRHLARRNQQLEDLGVDKIKEYFDYDLTESSRLHNKQALNKSQKGRFKAVYPDQVCQANLKILLGFHSEFILDQKGNFVLILDPDKQTENGLVNGASFNYANSNNKKHKFLDIAPVRNHDPGFRRKAMRRNKVFLSPNRKKSSKSADWNLSYFNQKGYFSYEGRSAFQRVVEVQKEFECLLRKTDA